MSVVIDRAKCVACGRCAQICPGNVIRTDADGKAYVKNPSDCWSCASCMKECAVRALAMVLPPEIAGCGGSMVARQKGHITEWQIRKANGDQTVFVTNTEEANKY